MPAYHQLDGQALSATRARNPNTRCRHDGITHPRVNYATRNATTPNQMLWTAKDAAGRGFFTAAPPAPAVAAAAAGAAAITELTLTQTMVFHSLRRVLLYLSVVLSVLRSTLHSLKAANELE